MISTGTYEKRIAEILRELGIWEKVSKRQPFLEATNLASVGLDICGREQKLAPDAAVAWLVRRAKDFGFTMSYPRDNKFGVIYEPWHWTFHDSFG